MTLVLVDCMVVYSSDFRFHVVVGKVQIQNSAFAQQLFIIDYTETETLVSQSFAIIECQWLNNYSDYAFISCRVETIFFRHNVLTVIFFIFSSSWYSWEVVLVSLQRDNSGSGSLNFQWSFSWMELCLACWVYFFISTILNKKNDV
jgi:hypothetical protein